ncbi:MAG: ribosomal silencing factor RsfS [Vicingaceae bacterium]|nr:MAG: ribosomal silencing factor RsfS [Vicingaceae bacterium]
MPKKTKKIPELIQEVVFAADDKKAQNIVCLDLRPLSNAVTDFFVIAEGTSNVQVESIANHIIDKVKENLHIRPHHSEGFRNAEWILIDYIDVVVHIFQKPVREFYNLEQLWGDAESIPTEEILSLIEKKKI